MKWKDQQLVADDNYPMARDSWRVVLEGDTLRRIAKQLTRRGVPTAKERRVWSATTIGSILANRSYAGVVEALKTEAVTPGVRRKATYGKTSNRARPNERRVPLEGLVVQQWSPRRSLSGSSSAVSTTGGMLQRLPR